MHEQGYVGLICLGTMVEGMKPGASWGHQGFDGAAGPLDLTYTYAYRRGRKMRLAGAFAT